MLYKISVFEIVDGIKKWRYSKEMNAENAIDAFRRADIRMPGRIIEIQEIEPFERPRINRISRDGIF